LFLNVWNVRITSTSENNFRTIKMRFIKQLFRFNSSSEVIHKYMHVHKMLTKAEISSPQRPSAHLQLPVTAAEG
jgi:hypothetical protein